MTIIIQRDITYSQMEIVGLHRIYFATEGHIVYLIVYLK